MTQLPNFFIIGAAKAGTTTLANILRQHPQAYLPFDKEPMFFSRDAFFQKGLDWYRNTYFSKADGCRAIGEASPHYLYWADKVARRISDVYADDPVRFIIILRNPVDRAYSWYWNMIREGLEDLPFEQALLQEPQRLTVQNETLRALGSMQFGYVFGSQYAMQITSFLEYFERDRFLFLLQDDLRQNFNQVCQQIFRFLEIEDQVLVKQSISNPASLPRSAWVQRALQGPSSLKTLIKRLMPYRVRYQAKRALLDANAMKTYYPPMQENTSKMLQNQFQSENQRLSELIGRDLSHWGKS